MYVRVSLTVAAYLTSLDKEKGKKQRLKLFVAGKALHKQGKRAKYSLRP